MDSTSEVVLPLYNRETGGKVRDANGNSIGRWSLDGE
jgi:hypothetical protein